MTSQNESMDELIRQAELSVKKRPRTRSSRQTTTSRSLPILHLAVIAIGIAILSSIFSQYHLSRDEINNDLQLLILQARSEIEARLDADGQLPPILSDAVLSTIVDYRINTTEMTPNGYSLTASMAGVTIKWSSGNP